MFDIDGLTIKQARELAALFGGSSSNPFEVGKSYLIRTVTMTQVGRVAKLFGSTGIWLERSSWVADTGRFYDALKTGTLAEIEPFPAGCGVMLGAIVDWAEWPHPLPEEQV